jgi:hypothetical protein
MDEELRKKAEEKKRAYDEANAQKTKEKQAEKAEKELSDKTEQEEVDKLLKQAEKEITEFEKIMIPTRRIVTDNKNFYMVHVGKGVVNCNIIATEDKRIDISMMGSHISARSDIRYIISRPELKGERADFLRAFLRHLPKFEEYYVDSMDKNKA